MRKEEEHWEAVDGYISRQLFWRDLVLEAVLAANAAAGLPSIEVSPAQGKLLQLLARISGARRVLEIGTLGGYSTIWLARGLAPGGVVVTVEAVPRHAEVARANFARAGMSDRVDLRVGRALDILPAIAAQGAGPFDLVFIDADKANSASYLAWATTLSRPGTVIVTDNVVRAGAVLDGASNDPNVTGIRQLFDRLREDCKLNSTAIQTVGVKGWDGFAITVVE